MDENSVAAETLSGAKIIMNAFSFFNFHSGAARGVNARIRGPCTLNITHIVCTNSKRNTTCDESTAAIQEKVGVVSAAEIIHGVHGRAKKEERGAPRRSIMIRVWSIHRGCGNEARSCIFGLGLKCLRHRRCDGFQGLGSCGGGVDVKRRAEDVPSLLLSQTELV